MGVIAPWFVWLGLFVGMENTSAFPKPFQQPGITSTTSVMFNAKANTARVGYIHPLQHGGYGPALQIGVSRRLF